MTPAELAAIVADPLNPAVWRIPEMTPAQLSAILAALATAGRTAHLEAGGAAPSAVYLPGDGGSVTQPTGTDSAGQVSVTTGTGSLAPLDVLTVTFAAAFGTPAIVVLTPADAATAAVAAAADTGNQVGTFTLRATSLPATTTLTWNWVAVQPAQT